MKRLLTAVSCAALAACGDGAGIAQANGGQIAAAVQRDYEAGRFDSVASMGPHVVLVTVGGRHSVRAEGAAETLDMMEVVVEDGELQIRPKRDHRRDFSWREHQRATFHVALPRLTAAKLSGSGEMKVDRVEGERFAAAVAGSGNLDIGSLRVDDAAFNLAGSGDLSARGSARRAEVSVAGSGNVHARDVASHTASVRIAGSGDASLTVEDEVTVSIAGSGNADIAGPARCTVARNGDGRTECGA